MFFEKLNGFIQKFRWFILGGWILAVCLIVLLAPSLSKVASTDQYSFLPNSSDAIQASKMIKQLYPDKGTGSSAVIVMDRKGGFSSEDVQYAKNLEKYLRDKPDFKVKDISSPFTSEKYKDSMLNKKNDAAFMIISLNIPGYKDITNNIVKDFRSVTQSDTKGQIAGAPVKPSGLTIHVTGDAAFGQEQMDNIQKSMAMTGVITVILVIIVLIIIYRSPVAFIIPLFTIGISFLTARGIVAALTNVGLQVSSFTQTFLIAVLFGAGTDYCLLMASRFREEIAMGKNHKDALKTSLSNSGIAIVSSGFTVIIGFAVMATAKFGLYKTTGPSIAIGVGVTILAVMTLTPSLLSILGEKTFWPAHPSKNTEKERMGSPFWKKLSIMVTSKPARFIIICIVIFTPFIISNIGLRRTFDQLEELPSSSDAKQGFQVITNNFDQGMVLPVKVVMKTDKALWTNESLQVIDEIAKDIIKVDGVVKVRTATRPLGEQINEMTLPKQIEMLSGGLDKIDNGIDPLLNGMDSINKGVTGVSQGLVKGNGDFGKLSNGTQNAMKGVAQVQGGLSDMSNGQQSAIEGLSNANDGIGQLGNGIETSKEGINNIYTSLQGVQKLLETLEVQQPTLGQDKNFLTAYGTVKGVLGSIPNLQSGMDELKGGSDKAGVGINSVSKGMTNIKSGLDSSNAALTKILEGMKNINDGQKQASVGLSTAAVKLQEISKGVEASKAGLKKVKTGLNEAATATNSYNGNSGLNGVFYLPAGALYNQDLKKAMEYYISPDGKGITFEIILDQSPYSKQALDSIQKIKDAISFGLKGTILSGSEFHLSGASAAVSELRTITKEDFIKVVLFVLLGIFIVLALLLRSITAPIYLILTILFSYATTMGITYLVFQVGLGKVGLSWSAPFFSFCLLVALGVDYNIFLMARVKEEYVPGDVKGGIARALTSTGKIITSCGIIMAGTFGAMIVSPVTELYEIGFATVVGLLLDTFIIRCLLVPAIAVKVGELNWWPGRKVKVVPIEKDVDINI